MVKRYVTMTDLMKTFYEKTELIDVICEVFSKSSGKASKSNFETKKSVLKPPIQLRIFLQIPEYNFEKINTAKIKSKLLFRPNIPFIFQINSLK